MTLPILSSDRFDETLPNGFLATVTRIPFGLATQDPLREFHDDRSIDVAKTMGSIWLHVEDPATGAMVACAVYAADPLVVRCDTVDVLPGYRRKGVATALYRIASREFAAPVVPSPLLSDDAREFWKGKTQISWP